MTPYSFRAPGHAQYVAYKFSDDSDIGQVKASDGNSSNYRFFEIQPIKWIVLNYDKFEIKNDKGEIINMPSLSETVPMELLANDVLVSGVAPGNKSWANNTINDYMNNQMFIEVFSPIEQKFVKSSVIYNNTNESDSNIAASGSNINHLPSGSNSTTQSLYLLSRYELENLDSPYIENGTIGAEKLGNATRNVYGTDYARAHNMCINATNKNSCWWVRTTNGVNLYYIDGGGTFSDNSITSSNTGTRPAMQQ